MRGCHLLLTIAYTITVNLMYSVESPSYPDGRGMASLSEQSRGANGRRDNSNRRRSPFFGSSDRLKPGNWNESAVVRFILEAVDDLLEVSKIEESWNSHGDGMEGFKFSQP
jgi:hypothetical protein